MKSMKQAQDAAGPRSVVPTYKPNPTCRICAHPNRTDIDAALIEGDTLRSIISRFGAGSPATLYRHKGRCWPVVDMNALATARVRAGEPPSESMAGRLVTKKADRLAALQAIWEGILRIIADRAAAFADVPGGSSGLLAVQEVSLRCGLGWKTVKVSEFDAKLVERLLDVHVAVTRETGEKLEQDGKVLTTVTSDAPMVVVMGSQRLPPGQLAEGQELLSAGERKHRYARMTHAKLPAATAADTDVEIEGA